MCSFHVIFVPSCQQFLPGAALLFAIGLLCSGQSSTLIATVAGQVVMEGFLNLSISVCRSCDEPYRCLDIARSTQPFLRRLLTRMMSLIPAMAVAIALGHSGMNQLLVASQVVLSIVLPFIVFPLVWLTANKDIMNVNKPITESDSAETGGDQEQQKASVDFSTGKIITGVGYLIWFMIVLANSYVIVMLCLGRSG
jgi:metal iron transporter